MASLYVLEFLLRKAIDVADGVPDNMIQSEALAGVRHEIRSAHRTIARGIGDIERCQAASAADRVKEGFPV